MDSKGISSYSMVDTGGKSPTRRVCTATGLLRAAPATLRAIEEGRLPKGNPLPLAEAAGITAVKKTSEILPLCHPLGIDAAFVRFEFEPKAVRVFCEVRAHAKTGVEMEALSGVSAALLCLIDLTKAIDPALEITDLHLIEKTGGKSGHWRHPRAIESFRPNESGEPSKAQPWKGIPVVILTLSDRCARGEREDLSGPALAKRVSLLGGEVRSSRILPDESAGLSAALAELLQPGTSHPRGSLVLTTGGTGVGPRDLTPETIASLGGRSIPGFGEKMRRHGERFTDRSALSRSEAFDWNGNLVICLPGSVSGAIESLEAVEALIPHALRILRGGDHG